MFLPCVIFLSVFLTNLFIFGCAGSSLLRGLSLVMVNGGYSLGVVRRLLVGVASCWGAQALRHTGSVAVALRSSSRGTGLRCPVACRVLSDQGSDPAGAVSCTGGHILYYCEKSCFV